MNIFFYHEYKYTYLYYNIMFVLKQQIFKTFYLGICTDNRKNSVYIIGNLTSNKIMLFNIAKGFFGLKEF